MASTLPGLLGLPTELLVSISSSLPNRDIKSLRLTCRRLFSTASLRLTRVFLSANPRNIDVFRSITDHETFRQQIVEIIWDDARLESRQRERYAGSYFLDLDNGRYYQFSGQCPRWFFNLVLASGADVDAFRYGLKRFPSLKRVTITPFAHVRLLTPLYETPMIRAFPPGFIYLIPHTWYVHSPGQRPPVSTRRNQLSEFEKDRYHGVRLVTRELAQFRHHNVTELIIDVNALLCGTSLLTGIDSTIFTEPCAEYNDLVTVLRRPGFRRLDLALLVGRQSYQEDWSASRSGLLRRALSEAPNIEHISLRTDETQKDSDDSGAPDRHFVPRKSIFPVDKWLCLRHFGLSQFLVRQNDLLSLLAALPATLRSVELSCLIFLEGTYRGLLADMRDTLDWRGRGTRERPKVIVGLPADSISERTIWVDEQVGIGVLRDAFDPLYERPNAEYFGQTIWAVAKKRPQPNSI
ncbi:hypothetical protein C8A01DRAFT_48313 [Parachaetomium inaequale]|uniref:F-box domain-containing protein n=1 Tax=Parachaetomium inaequale TaxID=2588326 RepID=A0AAN6PBR0_9PEZI|nr:hypothetical protein C8A01DRAFT_48313 [Parachaetomium inaequale]